MINIKCSGLWERKEKEEVVKGTLRLVFYLYNSTLSSGW
jgi:hypothetical protein